MATKTKPAAKPRKPRTKAAPKAAPSAPVETVLVLRTCTGEMKSHGGFVWPKSGPVEASATGYSGHASATGYSGWSIAGYAGKAKAAANGVITILYFDKKAKRPRVAVGYVGEGIEKDVWYGLNEKAEFVAVKE